MRCMRLNIFRPVSSCNLYNLLSASSGIILRTSGTRIVSARDGLGRIVPVTAPICAKPILRRCHTWRPWNLTEIGIYMELDHYDCPVSVLFWEMAGGMPRLGHRCGANVSEFCNISWVVMPILSGRLPRRAATLQAVILFRPANVATLVQRFRRPQPLLIFCHCRLADWHLLPMIGLQLGQPIRRIATVYDFSTLPG